ncbi:hypothetical protein AcV7_000273 [Taiwanofungus camphoratus]|nr:hypothetical protein AcV7_000273 [Antrodia cinnamomea]
MGSEVVARLQQISEIIFKRRASLLLTQQQNPIPHLSLELSSWKVPPRISGIANVALKLQRFNPDV